MADYNEKGVEGQPGYIPTEDWDFARNRPMSMTPDGEFFLITFFKAIADLFGDFAEIVPPFSFTGILKGLLPPTIMWCLLVAAFEALGVMDQWGPWNGWQSKGGLQLDKNKEVIAGTKGEKMPGMPSEPANIKEEPAVTPPVVIEPAAAPEPAPAPKAVTSGATEFKVTITKLPNSRLGIDVDLSAGGSLMVDQINEGLVMDWNKANPDKAVKSGDHIVEVNGSRGNAQQLTEVCKRDEKLEMTVKRGEP